jgi:hypothetical protein
MSMTGKTLGNFWYTALIGYGSMGKVDILPEKEWVFSRMCG